MQRKDWKQAELWGQNHQLRVDRIRQQTDG